MQKKEIVKGLFAEKEYKRIIAGKDKDIKDYLLLIEANENLLNAKDERLKGKDEIIQGKDIKLNIAESKVSELETDNKKLRRGTLIYKILLGALGGAYIYERIR